jgi:hypothetical protein
LPICAGESRRQNGPSAKRSAMNRRDLLAGQGKLKLMQGLKGDKITHAE